MWGRFPEVTDLKAGAGVLRGRRYGTIEAAGGRFCRVRCRPSVAVGLFPETRLWGWCYHRFRRGDRCFLYYRQPRRFPHYLAVPYFVSARGTSLGTVRVALEALDEIARIKGIDALLCDLANSRLSPALMARWGWVPHCPSRWHRHYIKRFYGRYPPVAKWLAPAPLGPAGGAC